MDCGYRKSETDCKELHTTPIVFQPKIKQAFYLPVWTTERSIQPRVSINLIVAHKPIVMSCEGYIVTML